MEKIKKKKLMIVLCVCMILLLSVPLYVNGDDTLAEESLPGTNSQQEMQSPENRGFSGRGEMPPDREIPERNGQWTAPDGAVFGGEMPVRERPDGQMPNITGNYAPDSVNSPQTSAKTNYDISDFLKDYTTPVISVLLLGAAFIFVIFYKRKTY